MSIAQTCNPERIEALLAGKLTVADETALTDHIADCDRCQQQLEQGAAAPKSWHEAHEYLQPIDETLVATPTKPSVQVQSVLDVLAPTDDPQMLGRLGAYEVSAVVGSGGMGIVLKGFDRSLDRPVAIKVLAPHLASSGAARRRFAREAKATAAVLHPNVIAIHSVSNDDALPWLVMPYVRGASLQKRLDQEGPMPVSEILRIGSQVAAGLAAAHAQGLVHRDIKPANILLEEGVERVTITDFGLARAVDDATMTRSGIIAGTPQYMSPEQARGEAVDGRSDLFSLGSVLYAMCTGHAPFRAETTFGVMRRITDDEPRSIREINPEIPAWLCAIIDKLMAKAPEQRFESSLQVAEMLEGCLAHVQQPASVSLPSHCQQLVDQKQQPIRRQRKIVRAAIATILFAALGIVWWTSFDPPDISGIWFAPDARIELEQTAVGKYTGDIGDEAGSPSGKLTLKWSPLQRRFNGTWRNSDLQFGKISLHPVGDEIHGARTISKKAEVEPGTPRLTEFTWSRMQQGDRIEPKKPLSPDDLPTPLPADAQQITSLSLGEFDVPANLESGEMVDIVGRYPGKQGTRITRTILADIKVYGVIPHTKFDRLQVGLWVSGDQNDQLLREMAKPERIYLARSDSQSEDRPKGTVKEVFQPRGGAIGKVTAIDNDNIAINVGEDDGLIRGDRVAIYRKNRFVGEATVFEVGRNRAAARVQQLRDGEEVRPGDTVDLLQRFEEERFEEKQEHKSTPDTLDETSVDFGPEKPKFTAGMSLAEAVKAFNDVYRKHPIGKIQLPLTENEVEAAMRWEANRSREQRGMSAKIFDEFKSIYEERMLPEFWKFDVVTDFNSNELPFKLWSIRISLQEPTVKDGQPGDSYVFAIREQTICQWEETATPPRPWEAPKFDESKLDPDAVPLHAAIEDFNSGAPALDGVEMTPLTMAEILAGIKLELRHRLNLTNRQYDEFRKIVETQQLPPGYRIEKLTSFQPGDGYRYKIWSVRLVIPKSAKPGRSTSLMIRNHFVSCRKVVDEHVSWGPVADNGLQAGVRLDPPLDCYDPGAIVTAEFFIRNSGDHSFEGMAFPRFMNQAGIVATHASGELNVEHYGISGPTGWIGVGSFGFGAQHTIRGEAFQIGGEEPDEDRVKSRILTKLGDKVRLYFTLPNYGHRKSPQLKTGEVLFEVTENDKDEE